MSLLEKIKEAWGWCGIEPIEIVGENDFGNVIVKDVQSQYWRICPEEGYCQIIAENRSALDLLVQDQSFLKDWYMKVFVSSAENQCGKLDVGRKYCLKIPGYLGGSYEATNFGQISFDELILFSGYLAEQTHNLPNGSVVELKITE